MRLLNIYRLFTSSLESPLFYMRPYTLLLPEATMLWSFTSGTSVQKDLDELMSALPHATRPITWDDEASCSTHSLINMVKNCAKPSLMSRVGSAFLSGKRKKSAKRKEVRHVVNFALEELVAEIPAATLKRCAESLQVSAPFTYPSCRATTSRVTRRCSSGILHCVVEEDEEEECPAMKNWSCETEFESPDPSRSSTSELSLCLTDVAGDTNSDTDHSYSSDSDTMEDLAIVLEGYTFFSA
jgi:hypothetical protein